MGEDEDGDGGWGGVIFYEVEVYGLKVEGLFSIQERIEGKGWGLVLKVFKVGYVTPTSTLQV